VEKLYYDQGAPMTKMIYMTHLGALFLIYFINSAIFGNENKTHLGGCGELDKLIKLDN
jgi:hypothetical protein